MKTFSSRTTLRQVADHAGVSIATASRVLNLSAPVDDAKRQAVLDAAQALDYAPNAVARALVSRRTRTLGVLITDNAAPTYAAVLHGIETEAARAGWAVLLSNSADSQERALRSLSVFVEKQVDGVLLTPVQTDRRDVAALRRAELPFVLLLRHFADDDAADWVVIDDERAGELMTDHVLDLGHRRVAHLAGPEHVSSAAGRRAGHLRALRRRGIAADPALVVAAEFSPAAGREAALELLARTPRPTAIVAATDVQAIGVLDAARSLGLRVPHDVSVTGGDDAEIGRFLDVPLTTFRRSGADVGALGARLLIDRIEAGRGGPERVALAPDLVVRASTGPPHPDPDHGELP